MNNKNQQIAPDIVHEPDGSYSTSIKEFSGIKISGSSALEVMQKLDDVLEMLQKSYSQDETDWAEQISEEDRKAIMQGIQGFENGNIHSHEEALKLYGKYL